MDNSLSKMSLKSSPRPSFKVLKNLYKNGEKIAMLTAYDATMSKLLAQSGVDAILIGDSLGQCIQGNNSTLSVSIEEICYHVKCVRKGAPNMWLIADIPFCITGADWSTLYDGATRLISAGANMIKIEGGAFLAKTIEKLVSFGIPVFGHLGLMPQHVNVTGGYTVQGRKLVDASRIKKDSKILQDAGISILLLECVPNSLAKAITKGISIPTIGIGAGKECSGQILVSYDALGLSVGYVSPKFVRNFMSAEAYTPAQAVAEFCKTVKNGSYPSLQESYG